MTKFPQISKAAAFTATVVLATSAASAALPVKALKISSSEQKPVMKTASVGPYVLSDTIVNENFSKWTEGSNEAPSSEMVTEEMAAELMTYPGDWSLFRMYEAGGAGFMGFDNIGDDGPGYIKTPGINLLDENGKEGIYRFSCRVMNVNENVTDQGLQAFIFDEATSMIASASAADMTYKEWTECSWIGSTKSPSLSFMAFGWKGEVLIDRLVVERLTYPLATPVVRKAEFNEDDGTILLTWDKVEGATSYFVEVSQSFNETTLFSGEVSGTTSCIIDVNAASFDDSFCFYVTACDGEKKSYPGYLVDAFMPDAVGDVEILPATDVTPYGFTANWKPALFASNYLVLPRVEHTAKEAETYYILNENFSNVPADADEFNAIMIAPVMNFNCMDLYWSRGGWSADMAMMIRLMPQLPVFALTNQYAEMGIPGELVSPVTDFSVGGGKVRVQGMAISSSDDVVMTCELIDSNGNSYSSEDFEITPDGALFDVNLDGGLPDSRLVLKITESCDGGDVAIFTNIAVSVELERGETITVPAETVRAGGRVTSADVKCDIDDDNRYSYAVMGYSSNSLVGAPSQYVNVNEGSAVKALNAMGAGAFISGGVLRVTNPSGEACSIYTLDGKLVKSFSEKAIALDVDKGIYIVKVGGKSFKLTY